MSNAVYPNLPGLKFGLTRASRFKTGIDESASGREYRTAMMVYPRRRVRLQYEFLRDERLGVDEFRTLCGFFDQRKGSFDSFLLEDLDDNSVVAQAFGVGNGATASFQLVRTFGGAIEPVYDLAETPSIYINAALQSSGYTVSSSGMVTFSTAPTAGQVLTWDGTYRWRVRFAEDEAEFEKFMQRLWQTGRIELIQVKP